MEQNDRRADSGCYHMKLDAMPRDMPVNEFFLYQYSPLRDEVAITCGKKRQALYFATTAVQAATACPFSMAKFISAKPQV
jgi:hypothetical protein